MTVKKQWRMKINSISDYRVPVVGNLPTMACRWSADCRLPRAFTVKGVNPNRQTSDIAFRFSILHFFLRMNEKKKKGKKNIAV